MQQQRDAAAPRNDRGFTLPVRGSLCATGSATAGNSLATRNATMQRRCGGTVVGGGSARVRLVDAQKQSTYKDILLWMTPSEAPKALQASECSELLDPTGASCWIVAQHQPGKFDNWVSGTAAPRSSARLTFPHGVHGVPPTRRQASALT